MQANLEAKLECCDERDNSQDVVTGKLVDSRKNLLPFVVVDDEVRCGSSERGSFGHAVACIDDRGGGDTGE